MTKTNTTTPIAPHPGQVWRTIIEDVSMTQSQVAEKMGASVAGLSRILRKAGVPSAPFTIKFAEATDSSVTEQWQIVADYMLAEAIAAKPAPAKKAPAKAPAKKVAAPAKAPAKRAARKAPAAK